VFQTDILENTASKRSAFLAEIISPLVFSQENLYNSLGAFCFRLLLFCQKDHNLAHTQPR
jgi:hypothetical protein